MVEAILDIISETTRAAAHHYEQKLVCSNRFSGKTTDVVTTNLFSRENIMNEKQMQLDWAFGLQWIGAYGLGIALLGMLAFASVWTVGEVVENALGETAAIAVVGTLFGALFALGTSGGTSLLLRSKGVSMARWIAYSVLGGTLGGLLGFGVTLSLLDPEMLSEVLTGLVIGLSLGLPIGMGQWLALRQLVNGASMWPLISTIALVLALMVGIPLGGEGREWLSLAVIGLLAGTISSLGMMWLSRQQTALA
jgi:hypothetical protein